MMADHEAEEEEESKRRTGLYMWATGSTRWQTVMVDHEAEEEESERRSGLCILIHRQNRFCHRKCRPVLPVN
jgi:hypothetical protein